MHWLHFIGQKYYTRKRFVDEARRYGITRRVSLQVLRSMDWDDTVLLAIVEGKTPVMFGQFQVTRLSGISKIARQALEAFFGVKKISDGGTMVVRGCGSYLAGPSYQIDASLPEIAEFLDGIQRNGHDIGKLMVGGTFQELSHPMVRLKKIPFRQGFRTFDYERFLEDLRPQLPVQGNKLPAVSGQYYIFNHTPDRDPGGTVEEVYDYFRREELKPAQQGVLF